MRVSDLDIDRIYANQQTRPEAYAVSANHFHCYYELFYVRQGKCRYFLNNRYIEIGAGEMLLIPPREVHNNAYLATTVRDNIYFRKTDIMENGSYAIPHFNEHFKQMQMIHIPSAHRPAFESLIDSMLHEESINDANSAKMLQLLLKQFFLLCNRYCTFRETPLNIGSSSSEDIILASHYIADHYHQQISLEEVASMVNLSPSYLSKKFHKAVGKTISEYLNSERLKHATLELISTNHTITEIALNNGFSDANYFKDVFKKTFGSSPRDYRKLRKAAFKVDEMMQAVGENDLIEDDEDEAL